MRRNALRLTPVCLLALTIAGAPWAQDRQAASGQKAADATKSADEEAVHRQAAEFAQLFAKGDAKGIAATWTEQAEYFEESGVALRGRAAIEQTFADFFQEHPACKVDVQIESIRFPAHDLAIEEGTMVLSHAGPELPTSSRYSVLHVRENGKWMTALGREWGGGEDNLRDLAWLIGDWKAKSSKGEVELSFAWNSTKSGIEGKFSVSENGKTASAGHQEIIRDPQSGLIHSWMFDEDGGHGESVWSRDGNRWVLDAVGVAADGSDTSATNLLTRLGENEFIWRSVNRTVGSDSLPDTDPLKATRVQSAH